MGENRSWTEAEIRREPEKATGGEERMWLEREDYKRRG